MKKYLTNIMLGLSFTLITDVWAMEDLQPMGNENPKPQVIHQSTLKNTPLKEKRVEPQQSLAARISSELAYFEDSDSDEENLTEFEYELMAMSRSKAPKDQIIILGTRLSF